MRGGENREPRELANAFGFRTENVKFYLYSTVTVIFVLSCQFVLSILLFCIKICGLLHQKMVRQRRRGIPNTHLVKLNLYHLRFIKRLEHLW